jgi:hypothetical protein
LRFLDGEPEEALQSGGMIWFELVDEAGDPVDMPGGKFAMSLASIPPVQEAGEWEAFVLDPDEAQWKDPTPPEDPNDSLLTYNLPGSGHWQVARRYPTACIVGTVQSSGDAGPDSCGGSQVKLGGTVGNIGLSSVDSIGSDGSFCLAGPRALQMSLSVGGYAVNVSLPPTTGSCADLSDCRDVGEIQVDASACDIESELPAGAFATGEACTSTAQCAAGNECFSGYCVGAGAMRVSLAFTAASDFDLHVMTPSMEEIYFDNLVAGGGELDVDQCVMGCDASTHVENVVFEMPPASGTYEVWVTNFGGSDDGAFNIEVSGAAEASFMGSLAAVQFEESEHFTFTVGAADAGP